MPSVTIPALNHKNITIIPGIPPTCDVEGQSSSSFCLDCETWISRSTTIPALGHDLVTHEAQIPSRGNSGWEEYVTCKICNYTTFEPFTDESPGRSHSHIWYNDTNKATNQRAPTCTEYGYKDRMLCAHRSCHGCSLDRTTKIPPTGHSFIKSTDQVKEAATCKSPATYYYKCENCGMSTKDLNGTFWIDDTETLKGEHNFVLLEIISAASCIKPSIKKYKCSNCSVTTIRMEGTIDNSCHQVEGQYAFYTNLNTASRPTCETEGHALLYCKYCNEPIKHKDLVPYIEALDEAARAAFCSRYKTINENPIYNIDLTKTDAEQQELRTTALNDEDCIIDKTTLKPPLGHNYTGAATTLVQGAACAINSEEVKYRLCTRCGLPEFISESIQNHVFGAWTTCLVNGKYSHRRICKQCNFTELGECDNQFNSSEDQLVSQVSKTCTTDGYKIIRCNICGLPHREYSLEEKATGHSFPDNWKTTDRHHTRFCNVCGIKDPENGIHSYLQGPDSGLAETCTVCNKVRDCRHPLDKHKIIPAIESTCSSFGLTEGKICEACNTTLVAQAQTSKKQHNFTIISQKAANCRYNQAGYKRYKCNDCGFIKEETLSGEHQIVTIPREEPSCFKAGQTAGSKCAICGTIFTYQQYIAAFNTHLYGQLELDYSCKLCKIKKCSRCGDILRSVEKDCTLHNITTCMHLETEPIPEIAPTCTASGSRNGTRCKTCEKTIVHPYYISPAGHDWLWKNAVPATCKDSGRSAGHECTRCGAIHCGLQVLKPTNTHSYGSWQIDNSTQDSHYKTCTVCGKIETAKCTFVNNTVTGHKCSVCGRESGHRLTITTSEATCTTRASIKRVCSVCNYQNIEYTGEAAPGHEYIYNKITPCTASTDGRTYYHQTCKNCDSAGHYLCWNNHKKLRTLSCGCTEEYCDICKYYFIKKRNNKCTQHTN